MGRVPALWTDETIELIKKHFVAAAVPTWVCRAEGPEGDFLRRAGIDKRWVTSSGYMHCVSASGKFLGGRASLSVLKEFQQLPLTERAPGSVSVPDLPAAQAVLPSPPVGGLVLKVHARFLSSDQNGQLRPAVTTDFPLMRDKPNVQKSWALFLQPNTEYLWLTRDEWQSLVPAEPTTGETLVVPRNIVLRMARFHLTPQRATTSEGHIVSVRSVKSAELSLLVDDASPQRIRYQATGFVRWGSDYDESQATTPNGPLAQGFESPLYGRLTYDREKQVFVQFDLVAPSHVWGRWGDANGKSMYVERPGRSPFGFALELATGNSPTNRLPPGGNGRYVTEATGYFSVDQ